VAEVDPKSLQPFGLGPRDLPSKPIEALEPGEATVTMLFPRTVILLAQNGKRIEFLPGIQQVPEHLTKGPEGAWLARNSAVAYDSVEAQMSIAKAKDIETAQAEYDRALAALNAAKSKAVIALPSVSVPVERTAEQIEADELAELAEMEEQEAKDAEAKAKADADLEAALAKQKAANQRAQQARRR
jgi:hypothetical protein